jgi:hypothetical protein
MNHPLLQDRRGGYFDNKDMEQYFWLYYYSGACSVEKSVFEAVGGFDESFTAWGGEDIDLGKRIAEKGSIRFLHRFHSIHVPHGIDVVKQEKSSDENILKMLGKYGGWEFEVLYAFSSGIEVFRSFYNVINNMRMVELKTPCYSGGLNLYPISADCPNGLITYYEHGVRQSIEALGLATNFRNKQFDTAHVLDTVFIYPSVITSRILQEMCRIGSNVFIMPTGETTRIDWSNKVYLSDKPNKPKTRLTRQCSDIMDFKLHRLGDGILEVVPIA